MAKIEKRKEADAKICKYKNKLEWKCANGHKWWATPKSVRKGHWCSECYGNAKLDLNEIGTCKIERESAYPTNT